MISVEQQAIRAGMIELCKALATGGTTWLLERRALSMKLRTDQYGASSNTITAYLMQERAPAITVQTASGSATRPTYWRVFDFGPLDDNGQHTHAAQDIQPGDTLTSTTDPRFKLTIGAPGYDAGFASYAVEVTRP